MARNRKRAKERRNRRPPQSAVARQSLATAPVENGDSAPDPIEHAAPDVELADAQLALGRPELVGDPEAAEEELEAEAAGGSVTTIDDGPPPAGGTLAAPTTQVGEPRARPGSRLINFLQGSWRELQRVQWPDRRQVIQATGVVIGFVIVAGVFLGVADEVAGKLMNLILK